ncbi:uncharacterized protein LOC115687645 [Syzygium oleosum]|uniref:uncharacterized protein LOC115687645 n=1 Tax=Syzygium oleosum TaxID=219896 RepID=UPI0024B8D9C1|nr:uncharacterized protein LOC115687645 [Syzygium oleosum]XP_056173506.1 uncharacterized protein LOC115687645 [Syzygium oleosum]XP_056173507.1 uncharacterized protein LOC115687645 [Syzygium oleosum]XP_056173508.1 uncharacterized protein LOC115687645 [Syzygium oleosum]
MDATKILDGVQYAVDLVRKVSSDTNKVKGKMGSLKRTMGMLSAKKADVSFELEQEERRPGKKRKEEVDFWMQSVASVEDRVHRVGRKLEEGHFLSPLILENEVNDLKTEVEELHKMGRFEDGLTLDVEQDPGFEIRPGELVGQASQPERLISWEINCGGRVLLVRPAQQWGVDKTFLKHIGDQTGPDWTGFNLVNGSEEGTAGMTLTNAADYFKGETLEDRVAKFRPVTMVRFLSPSKVVDVGSDLMTEVKELHEMGRFEDGLTLDGEPYSGLKLWGPDDASLKEAFDLLDGSRNEKALVGVWGQGGADKTIPRKHLRDEFEEKLIKRLGKLEEEGRGSECLDEYDWDASGAESSVIPIPS